MTKVLLFAVCTSVAIYACGDKAAPIQPKLTANPVAMSEQNINVTNLYNETCAKCHGTGAEGGGAGTKSLNTKEKFDQKYDRPFFDAVKNGVADMGMEAYGDTMSDATVWAMVVHIRELQARALRTEFGGPRPVNGVYVSQRAKFRIETIVDSGLNTPWSIDWLSDGSMLVTNRPGGLFVFRDGNKIAEVLGLPSSVELGQGGLMEVAIHQQTGWVYISFADPASTGRGALTKVVRGKISVSQGAANWTNQETIYQADQKYYSGAGIHFGCKIAFDETGHVFFTVGERGTQMRVQKENESPYGKVMRLNLDGSVPSDNPIAGNPMWSTGHRNQQGLAFDLEGKLWDTEHGPRGGDEVNLIKKGANYGWPVRALSINYNDAPFATPWNAPGENFEYPVFRWLPSIGASGLDVARGNAFPAWKGDLLAGGLSGNNLDRIRMKDGALVEREELLFGLGRVRDIAVHKDGTVYVALNGPDKVIRLVPAT